MATMMYTAAHAAGDNDAARGVVDQAYRVRNNERTLEKLYGPGLRGAIEHDRKATAKGDAPNLDYDPICQCQDDAGLRHRILSSTIAGTTAIVVVENSYPNDPKIRVTYHLRQIGGHWLIDDIEAGEIKSLTTWLNKQPH